MHSKVRNIPRNTQLRGRLFDKWPRKGLSGACCGPSGEVSGAPTGRGPACSAARDRGGTGSSEVQTGRAGRRVAKKVFRREDAPAARTQKKCSEGKMRPPPGRKKSVPRGRCAAARTHTGTKKTDLGPFTSISATLLLYGLLLRDARPIHPAARQRLRTPGARLFCGRLPAACSPATACLPSISVCPSVGVTAVKASAIRSLSRSAARRSGLSRLAAGISAVRVAPVKAAAARVVPVKAAAHRPGPSSQPPGSQFSAAGVTVLSRRGHSSQPPSGPISQPPGVSAVRSPELAVPAARPLRRRGHSTTTSVWPSTCNWRISCVELT